MNKICPESLQFWDSGTEYELEQIHGRGKGLTVWTILQALLRAFDIQETRASLNISFSYQMEKADLNMEDSIKPGKFIFHWLSPDWGDLVVAKGTTVAWIRKLTYVVNWCICTGKQMNIWRTPGCELVQDAMLLLALCMYPIYTQSSSCQFLEKAVQRSPVISLSLASFTVRHKLCSALHPPYSYLP